MRNIQLSVALIVLCAWTMVTGFNCSMAVHDNRGEAFSDSSQATLNEKPDLSVTLLNAEQTLASMLNIAAVPLNEQIRNEYVLRRTGLAVESSFELLNGPLLISSTSLAGEICRAVISKEKPLAALQRFFFQGVDFNSGVDKITAAQFLNNVEILSTAIWSRKLSDEEIKNFSEFYTDFLTTLTPVTIKESAQTNALYLSTCAVMFASFDSLTY